MYRDLCYLPFVFKNDDNNVEYQTSSLIFIKSETLLMNWTELWTLRFITHPSSSRSPCFSVPLGSSSCVFSSLLFSSYICMSLTWIDVYAKSSLCGSAQRSVCGRTWRLCWCLWSAAEMKGLRWKTGLARNTSALMIMITLQMESVGYNNVIILSSPANLQNLKAE